MPYIAVHADCAQAGAAMAVVSQISALAKSLPHAKLRIPMKFSYELNLVVSNNKVLIIPLQTALLQFVPA
jgi:hypothetical protein